VSAWQVVALVACGLVLFGALVVVLTAPDESRRR
jgi:hypothetical protein